MAHFKGVDFFPHGLRLPIVENRRYFIGISWALAILSAILIMTKGLNFGVDFKGGSIDRGALESRARSTSPSCAMSPMRPASAACRCRASRSRPTR